MSTNITRLLRANSKNLVVTAVFLAAMAGAAGLGLATKQFTSAAGVRDTGTNPIFNADTNGGIGCLTAKECVADLKANKPGDIQAIVADSRVGGLSPSEYTRFEQTAKMGKTFRNGDVYVNNQIVMRGANSMGREKFNSARKPITIGGKTYYYSSTQNAFAAGTDSIDTLVMFDSKGVVETALMTACGNPVWGTKVTPEYDCKALNKKEVAKDTYDFTTSVHYKNNATVNKVVYDFGDDTPAVTKTNPAEAVRHKYEKPGTFTAKVTVYFNLPGMQVVAVPATKCATQIKVEEPPKPFYACTQLAAAVLNDQKTKFRFTVKTSQGNGATLKDADFTLDGTSTVTGVTTKDAQGNVYREYEFARDGKPHTVVVKVNFNIASAIQSKSCEAKVTSGQTPMCPIPGKEHLPADSDQCVDEKCPIPGKEHLPKNSDECVEPPVETPPAELPKTGMGSVLGIFAGTTAAGAVGHKLFVSRRRNG